MSTTLFLLYLLLGFCVAILSVRFISHYSSNNHSHTSLHRLYASRTDHVWPELKLNWRLAIATVIGFLGSAFGTVGGVGGGGIFVPVLTLVVGFDTKSAAALSKCMIMGASASSVCYNVRVAHPTKAVAILDYHLALLFQPMLMLGVTVGVSLSVVFPYWLITLLVIILFLSTSSRSFCKGAEMWRQETLLKQEFAEQQATLNNSPGELQIDTTQPLIPKENMPTMQIIRLNLRWKWILTLTIAWVCFLLLQVIKNDVEICSAWYWVFFCLQFPVAIMVYGYEAVKLYREQKKRKSTGNPEMICEATIEWSALSLAFCAFCGILGGTVGGLLGSGGGFILGPLLLEIGVIPQVASATATFVMMFSSSLSVVEFYLLKRFPIPYALYLTAVSVLAGFCGQFFVRKLITIIGRASIIVFILSGVIFASAFTMGVVGIEQSIQMIHEHEFMGFLGFCESQ